MAMNLEAKLSGVDNRRYVGEMPANIEAVVGRENALVKDFEWGLQQRRARPLQDHRALLRKVRYQLALPVPERQLDGLGAPGHPTRRSNQAREAELACARDKVPPRQQV